MAVEKVDSFSYVPILDVIERMLLNTSIFEEVSTISYQFLKYIHAEVFVTFLCIIIIQIKHDHKHNDDFLEDFCDGKKYITHPFFSSTYKLTLQLILYFDELEICNPLGSSRKKHKLGRYYFLLEYLIFSPYSRFLLLHHWKHSSTSQIEFKSNQSISHLQKQTY